jgi:Trk K+ transport system NAD-binding subunit
VKLIIVGAGEVGKELLKRLQKDWKIALVDQDEDKLKSVIDILNSESLSRITLIVGDGTSKLLLQKAGISEATAFVACTGDDEANLEACRIAKEFNVPTIYAVSNSTKNDERYEREGINYVNKAIATASLLEKEIESGIITPSNIGLGQGEIIEIAVMPTSIVAGYPVGKFSSRKWEIVAIFRGEKLILPKPKTIIKPGDRILIVGDPKILKYIADLIKSGEPQFPLQFGNELIILVKEEKDLLIKDARFFYENTKLSKVKFFFCREVKKTVISQFENPSKMEVSAKQIKNCENELLKLIGEETYGMVVLPPIYREFPMFFGIKTFPIKVAEQTLSPVVMAKGTTPVERILVPVSGSFSSLRALEISIELSLMANAEITALYVSPFGTDGRAKRLQEKITKISTMYKKPIEFKVRKGNPVREFAEESKNYSLTVIGARKGRNTNWFNPYPPYHMFHRSKCTSMLIVTGE